METLQTVTMITLLEGAHLTEKPATNEKQCWVYWIHLPNVHTDITREGYVGITTRNVKVRYACHKSHAKSGKKTRLYDAMRKYGEDVEVKTVLIGSLDYCLDLEKRLRPEVSVGWNTGIGGEKPTIGYKHSEDAKQAIGLESKARCRSLESRAKNGLAHKGKTVSKETRDKLSASHKVKANPPWMNPAANKDLWAIAETVADYISLNPEDGIYLIGKHFKQPMSKLKKIVDNTKAGWNPSTDESFQLWLSQYKNKECNESTHTITAP